MLVTDPRELEMPNVGLVNFTDAETGETSHIDTASSEFREQLATQSQQRVADLEHTFRSAGIDFIHVDASGSVVDPLVKFFRMRERRMRR